jgi:hypothetical protein
MKYHRIGALFVGPQGLRAGWGLLLFAITLVVLTILLTLTVPHVGFMHRITSNEVALLLAEGLMLGAVSGSTAVMAWVEGRGVWAYGLRDRRALSRVLWGTFWGVALLTLLIGGLFASGYMAIERGDLSGAEAVTYALVYAAGFFVVALAEELLFRGYLQFTLARLVGFWPAACLLSLAFGLVHEGNPGESLLGLLSVVLIGLIFCLCLRLSGSLWWGIGFHAAWDWAQSFLWGTPVSGFVLEGRLLQSHALADPLWSGRDTGPEGSLLILPVLGLTVLVIVRSFLRTDAAASV